MADAGEADFRTWVGHHRSRLRTTAYLLCGDWFLADDLVQDALLRTSAGNVKSQTSRGLAALREELQAQRAPIEGAS